MPYLDEISSMLGGAQSSDSEEHITLGNILKFLQRKNATRGSPMPFDAESVLRLGLNEHGPAYQLGAKVTDLTGSPTAGALSYFLTQPFEGGPSGGPSQAGIVYHGSPHLFDAFKMSKIGTGEGAQAYGHGLYFAENPKVATEYSKLDPVATASPKRSFMGQELTPGTPEYHAGTLLEGNRTLAQARKEVSGWIAEGSPDPSLVAGWKKTLDTLNKATKKGDFTTSTSGNLYKVDLPDEAIGKMLDWDKPLSQQPESVRNALSKVTDVGKLDPNITGQKLLSFLGSPESAHKSLLTAGIPGIKYLDQVSRASGKGTYNYVVFDENLPKIVGRE